ncbi:MAG: peptidoglycan DD-metalloendopeptidase family protein [Methylicorpusculum sp.]|uniref:murein hydrolase activator EnvC family protein n=1 Tax=Methylicorpusculum sp. TaxID=2713644 RepID=UPI00271AC9F1|nr:peptidoglycan DD-metalloendopeptidase family protein [Methylicorpusculum sp.]MDO8845500.1 peptidoglycan DD-metalloendopeptidase family protein [Methylicorpusculum sp.]MDO8938664.1 peptidoglycan DD-metalloendopeptidase family protein [Methylicorpusculum sp.]MDO9241782.1 peptidoglycan DD-metalloendopeptidase family protein [Methylicorpusculum sp.]MDP2179257.1 peptidoglycan DD-metalloendopeptidase family protein [Methylicorpusculum sp.]MDP2200451.1 peptidoglycan DD-metalloendopeptidase family 
MGRNLLSGILYLLCMALVQAGTDKTADELIRIQSEISQANKTLTDNQEQQTALMSELAEIEKQYGITVVSLKAMEKQIAEKQQKLRKVKDETSTLSADISEQKKALEVQIKAAYAMGKKDKLKLMLNQQDPALSSRILVYYDYLNKDRLAKLDYILEAQSRLTALELEQVKDTEILEQNLKVNEAQQKLLVDTQAKRKELLALLEKDYSSTQAKLSQLQEGEQRLQKVVAGLQRFNFKEVIKSVFDLSSDQPFEKLKGNLPWPVEGQIVQKFGSQRMDSRWDGVLIEASEGTELKAVSNGRVVFADWLRGYGLLIIIDHNDGYMTLYAFNQSLYKSVGDQVKAGEVIAAVGKSGGRDQPGLYFGVREQGKPVDPLLWCKQPEPGEVG